MCEGSGVTWYDRSLQRIKLTQVKVPTGTIGPTHPPHTGRTGLTDLSGVLAVPSPVV